MNWINTTLGQLIDVKHGYAFQGEFFSDSGDFVLLTPGNCYEKGGLKLKGDKELYYTGDFPREYLLKSNDLLIVMTDLVNTAPVLGGAFFIPKDNMYLHNQRLGLVKILKENKVDKTFLYYLLNVNTYRGQVRGSASGATVKHTSPGRIKKCKIRIPLSLKDQQCIGNILSAYDDLIDTNRWRIQLLEEAARLLFREWFVHFRFPLRLRSGQAGHEKVKIIDGVPEGWRKRILVEVADITMGQSPKSEYYNDIGEGLPFHQGVTGFGNRYPTNQTYCTQKNRMAQAEDILFSVRAPVGRINISTEKIIIGRGLSAIRTKENHQSYLFYELKNHFFKEDMIGGGAIFAAITKKDLETVVITYPDEKTIEQFENITNPIDRQIEILSTQNQKLAQARDLLLPRLMSGAIEV